MSIPTVGSIKGYELLELIGEGAYGAVYRAHQPVVDREVAVKIILPEYANRPEFIRRFESEAQLVAQLEHLHIVPLYDYWRDPGGAYLVMRLMKGDSLEEIIQEGPLSLSRTARIMGQVASALTAAHRRGIVHRDIKPANILLDEEGNAYLSDFGIAKALGEESGMTVTGAIVGTPAYITPEQVQSMPVSPQTDIYALGVVLYTMLTGKHPFPEASSGDLIAKHLRDPIPHLEEIEPNLPPNLDEVIQRATAKDPLERFNKTSEFISAFNQALFFEKDSCLDEVGLSESEFVSGSLEAHGREVSSEEFPHNIPSDLTPFVGRENELQALEAMFTDPKVRLVTILGAGGMGKTRLAMAFGQSQLEAALGTNGREEVLYPQGIFFIPLAAIHSSDSIVPTIAEMLGYRLSEKRDPENQLIDYLREKEILLILDNYEHLLDGTGLIVEILNSATKVKVLATSRARLNISGEHRFQLKGMDLPESYSQSTEEAINHSSIRLFLQCACRAQTDFNLTNNNVHDVIKICELLEGIPLAIRLAAAWVDMLSPEEIIGEIEHSLDLLETEVGDIPERHSSMRAVFDHSWNQIADRERDILGGLSVFRGGFTRQAAEWVTGASLRELKTLINKSLINTSAGQRFDIHELLRQYIAENRASHKEKNEQMRDLHCDYFTKFLHARNKDLRGFGQFEVLEEIERESANLQLAWRYAVEKEQVQRLYQALDGLCRFYLWRRRFQEGRAACREAEIMLSSEPADLDLDTDYGERLRLLARIMIWHSVFCEHKVAREKVEEALVILERIEDVGVDTRRGRAFALQELGDLTIDFDREEAEQIYEQSLALYRLVEDNYGEAQVMTSLGWVCAHKGEPEEARRWGEESLSLQRSIGDQKGMADTLWMLGTNAIISDEVEESVKLINESLEIRQSMGDRLIDIASGPVDLGMTLTWIGRMEEAKEVRQETLAIYQDLGNIEEVALAHVYLGNSLAHLGEYSALLENVNIGLTLGRKSGNQRAIGLALLMLSSKPFFNQSYDETNQLLHESIASLKKVSGAGELGWVLSMLAYTEHRLGEYKKSLEHLREAFILGRGILATITAWIAIPVYAVMQADSGEFEQAIELYEFMSRYPFISRSHLIKDLFKPTISLAESMLPREKLIEAQTRCQARNLKDTIVEIIAELEYALDDGMNQL